LYNQIEVSRKWCGKISLMTLDICEKLHTSLNSEKERPMQEALVVRREQQIAAPPSAVFALLTDPEKILRWMGTEAQLQPQPGGLYLVNVTGARFARGQFREVVPVHRLAYSFGWEGSEEVPPGSSLVEIDLIDQPPNGTLLRLTHTGLPSAAQCENHAKGWAHYVGRLAEAAAGRDPGPDPSLGQDGQKKHSRV
jgi:uncharacterized protein YndB with AHSA1/START domain